MSWRNTKEYKDVSLLIEKEVTKIDKGGNESVVTMPYETKLIDSARFMASSLSNLANNLVQEVHTIKCKVCGCFLEYESVKDNLMKYKFPFCKKYYSKTKFKFSNNDINQFIMLIRKGVYL